MTAAGTADEAEAVVWSLEDGVLWATLNRPRARNAIDLAMVARLEQLLETAERSDVRVLVLRGAGGSFCAGADLHEVRALREDPPALESFMRRLGAVLCRMEQGPFATVAAVEGYAVAGGCELLLASDVALATEDAQIGDRHANFGLAPAAGGSVRLLDGAGHALARYLLLTGDLISGAEAARAGLIARAVPSTELDGELERLVDRLRSRGKTTLRALKTMIAGQDPDRAERLERELELFMAHASTSEVEAGLAAFAAGRRTSSVEPGASA